MSLATPSSPEEAKLRKLFHSRFEEIEERIESLNAKVEAKDAKIREQAEEIQQLKARTEPLVLTGEEDSFPDAKTRRAMLLSYLKRKAEKRPDSDRVSINTDEWRAYLGEPDLDRTTFTKDLSRTAKRVDWDGIKYKNGELRADFSVELPDHVVTTPTRGEGL